jgi:ribosomal protein L37AE/L43A
MDTARFEHLWRVSNLFAKSDLVPQHYKGKPENCMLTCQMAMRLSLEPLMLMQNTYIVHGRPGMEGKLVIALVNTRGPFTGPIEWEFDDEENPKKCTAFATHKITNKVCKATITWKMVEAEGWNKKEGSKWLTIPAQMFRYRSAVFLARAYCPEVTFGFPTVQELRDVGEPERKRPVSPLEEKLGTKQVESKVVDEPVVEDSAEPEKPDKKKKVGSKRKPKKKPEPAKEEEQQEVRFFCPDCDHEFAEAKELKGLFQCGKCLNWNVVDRYSKEEPTEQE